MAKLGEQRAFHSVYSRILARVLHLQERDLPRLLHGTGLPTSILMPGDESQLTGLQQVQVLANAQQMESTPELGLLLGRQTQPSTFGPIGYLALSSPNLLAALEALRDFLPLRISVAKLSLDWDGDRLCCALNIDLDAPEEYLRILIECLALMVQAVIESVLGRPMLEGEFAFHFPRPDYSEMYDDYLHSPVLFAQRESCVRIPALLLQTENASGDLESYTRARNMCHQLLSVAPADSLSMIARVRRLLLSQLPVSMNEEEVASALFVCKRTLARRLAREGSSYRAIREELLSQLAARHLRESDSSVEAIAALLGYYDAANFRRAFRRWYGVAPTAFRATASTEAQEHLSGMR